MYSEQINPYLGIWLYSYLWSQTLIPELYNSISSPNSNPDFILPKPGEDTSLWSQSAYRHDQRKRLGHWFRETEIYRIGPCGNKGVGNKAGMEGIEIKIGATGVH